jgi:hypothetical protein
MINLFFSYSHKDESLRDELDKHLSILKRQSIIDTWHDRRISAGSEFNSEISHHLKGANIILLLTSSDFLASNYCYDLEMQQAMQMHESKQAVVIPVILRPCDWHDTLFGKLMATPKDGKPVTKFASLDEAFLEVTHEIKRVAKALTPTESSNTRPHQPAQITTIGIHRSSNLRISKTFSDHDKDKYLDDAFEYIANYFEGSLKELKNRNASVDYRFKRVDSETFNASVYIGGQAKAECMIFYGNSFAMSKGIIFSYNISSSRSNLNEAVYVADDGYNLYLKPIGISLTMTGVQRKDVLTNEGAAEYFWSMFIHRLQ